MELRTDGAYMEVNTDTFIMGKDGVIQKQNYGLWQKMRHVIKYGKTLDVYYSYVSFYKNPKLGLIDMHRGSIIGEFTEVLKNLKYPSHFNKVDYKIIGDTIHIQNEKEHSLLTFSKDLERLYFEYIPCKGSSNQGEYIFYKWI